MSNALVPVAHQVITAYVQEDNTNPAVIQMQQVVQKTYQWTDAAYKAQALEHLLGLHLAYQCGLSTQISLHTHKIQEFYIRDFVQRTVPSMPNHNKYSGFIYPLSEGHEWFRYRSDFALKLSLPVKPFDSYWQFYRIADFKRLIPPVALHFLAALAQVGLTRDDFLVAEYKPPVDPPSVDKVKRTIVDPILFANCGCALVALADWV